jgi:hypothetical protein
VHARAGLGCIGLLTALLGCREVGSSNAPDKREDIEIRDGQAVAQQRATALYTAKFAIRAIAVDADNLYVSGLRFPKSSNDPEAPEPLPTGVIMKVPLLGVPTELAEGEFIPMNKLELFEGRLYWHQRDDSSDGGGLRSLGIEGGEIERVSTLAGDSWVVRSDVVYFTRPVDEIDEGGFYRLERKPRAKPKLQVRRRGVVRSLLTDDQGKLYWLTRRRADGTWAVFEWDGERSGSERLHSDETFASLAVAGDDFLWVTWAEDEGQPVHSLYRRPIAGGDTQVLARNLGPPGFMEVFADEAHVYLGTVSGGELRRITHDGGEIEIVAGSGDRMAIDNRFNLFWVDGRQVYWRGK